MKLRHRIAVAAAAVSVACAPAPKPAEISAPKTSRLANGAAEVKETAPDLNTTPEPTSTVTVATTSTTVAKVAVAEFVTEVGDVEWLVRQTFPENPDEAALVAWCESRFDPTAGFPSGPNLGVMQLAWPVHAARVARMGYGHDDLVNPVVNLAVARAIYDEQGWRPWSCR